MSPDKAKFQELNPSILNPMRFTTSVIFPLPLHMYRLSIVSYNQIARSLSLEVTSKNKGIFKVKENKKEVQKPNQTVNSSNGTRKKILLQKAWTPI